MSIVQLLTIEDAREAFRAEAELLSASREKERGSSPPSQKPYLSSADVQRELGISKATLARWRNEGLIRFSKVLGKLLYRREDIDRLVREHVVVEVG